MGYEFNSINKGADSNWYKELGVSYEPPVVPVYYKDFRQRDTLMGVPKILEEEIANKSEEAYETLVSESERRLSALEESRDDILPIYNKDYIDPPEEEEEDSNS